MTDRILTPNGPPAEGTVSSTPRSVAALYNATWVYTMNVDPKRTTHHPLDPDGYVWAHDYVDGLPPHRGVSIQIDFRCQRCMMSMASIYMNQPERAHRFLVNMYGEGAPPELWGVIIAAAEEHAGNHGWIDTVT